MTEISFHLFILIPIVIFSFFSADPLSGIRSRKRIRKLCNQVLPRSSAEATTTLSSSLTSNLSVMKVLAVGAERPLLDLHFMKSGHDNDKIESGGVHVRFFWRLPEQNSICDRSFDADDYFGSFVSKNYCWLAVVYHHTHTVVILNKTYL